MSKWLNDLEQRSGPVVSDNHPSYVLHRKSPNVTKKGSSLGEVSLWEDFCHSTPVASTIGGSSSSSTGCTNSVATDSSFLLDTNAIFESFEVNDFRPAGGILWSIAVSSPEEGLIAVTGQRKVIDVYKYIDSKFIPYCVVELSEAFEKTIRYIEFAPTRVQGLVLLACCSFDSTAYIMSHEPDPECDEVMRQGGKVEASKVSSLIPPVIPLENLISRTHSLLQVHCERHQPAHVEYRACPPPSTLLKLRSLKSVLSYVRNQFWTGLLK